MNVALAGPSLSGKTTLFNALSNHAVDSQAHPARADHPNVASVKVHDARVDWIAELHGSAKKTYADLELLDLPGVALGSDADSERPRVLAQLRQADALLWCLRAFESDAVPTGPGGPDPWRDYGELRNEFLLADLEVITKRVERVEAALQKPLPGKEKEQHQHELALLKQCQKALESEQSLRPLLEKSADAALLSGFGLLTQKPSVVVLNVDENHVAEGAAPEPPTPVDVPRFVLCAQAESEILQLPPEERTPFLEDMGLDRLRSEELVRNIYGALNRVMFFTTSTKETRAWTVPKGATALEAAGTIHTDMARGFIRAEVVAFDDLREAGTEKDARAAGKVRLEGKDYVVREGDVLFIRFSV